MSSKSQAAAGQALWAKMPKANAELFALTYGSLVTELVRDCEWCSMTCMTCLLCYLLLQQLCSYVYFVIYIIC